MDHRLLTRPLGRTGLEPSVIGFGAFKIGRNEGIRYPAGYDLPDEDAVAALLNGVLDLGITLIDTAPAYGLSEERIGRHLEGRRNEFVLSTKVGETFEDGQSSHDFSSAAIRQTVRESLRRLRTDCIDLLLLHSDGSDLEIQGSTDAVETLIDLRDAGLVRAIGFSGKTVDGAEEALGWADAIMVEYSLEQREHDAIMRQALGAGVGVLVKKGLASGRLDPAEAVPFALAHPGVTSLVLGSLDLAHLQAAVELAPGPPG